jgi:hypothetical protein
LWLISDKEVVQVPGDESGGRRLFDDDVDDVLTVPRPGLTEEGLDAVVMQLWTVLELPI